MDSVHGSFARWGGILARINTMGGKKTLKNILQLYPKRYSDLVHKIYEDNPKAMKAIIKKTLPGYWPRKKDTMIFSAILI